MQYKCKVEVIDKKVFPELQDRYLADPKSGSCPFYQIGDTFLFERYGKEDTFWTMGKGSQCSEAWDCISRYIYTALQGGSIMRNWTNDEHMMIACCNDGTRPVIFKITRLDYKVLVCKDPIPSEQKEALQNTLKELAFVTDIHIEKDGKWIEVFCDRNHPVEDEQLLETIKMFPIEIVRID